MRSTFHRAVFMFLVTFGIPCSPNPLDPFDQKIVQKLYQILKDVHDFFSLYHIQYWVDSGTLLGAVRHNGLIPWDDDVDLCMHQKYEQQFLDLCSVLVHAGYEVVSMPYGYKIYPVDGQEMENRPWKYPSCDIFIVIPADEDMLYAMRWNQEHSSGHVYMKMSDLFPLRQYVFGPLVVWGPANPYPYLNRWYGEDWYDIACTTYDHTLGKAIPKVSKLLSDRDRKPALPYEPLEQRITKYNVKQWPADFFYEYIRLKTQ